MAFTVPPPSSLIPLVFVLTEEKMHLVLFPFQQAGLPLVNAIEVCLPLWIEGEAVGDLPVPRLVNMKILHILSSFVLAQTLNTQLLVNYPLSDAESKGTLWDKIAPSEHQQLLQLQEQPSDEAPRGQAKSEPALVSDPLELTPEEQAAVERLRIRDQQVRQEEQAHAANAGDLAGPINYTTVTGPDGRSYAVGGSVGIRAQVASGDPAEAERIGVRLAAAAHAAVNPSAQDLSVARQGYGFAEAMTSEQQPGAWLDIRT